MGVITFKCPNCGGELKFEPASGRYVCEYCGSIFSQEELDAMYPAAQAGTAEGTSGQDADAAGTGNSAAAGSAAAQDSAGTDTQDAAGGDADSSSAQAGEAVVYSCPSCGAEIVTDATTAATFCYYCHNPVILEGRLSGSFLPDSIIPFEIDRKKAEEIFLSYVKSKKFLPKAFFDKSQIEKLSGVYYPYWVYDCEMAGSLSAEGRKVRVWMSGDTEYTETKIYQIDRSAEISIKDQTMHALSKSDRDLVVNVQPYDIRKRKPFSMGYLSGFFAEKRDLEKAGFEQQTRQTTQAYAQALLKDTAHGFTSISYKNVGVRPVEEKWSYCLLPVWVLTYRTLGQIYYFALNGQTGSLYGKLPVDNRKLALTGLVAAMVVFGLCLWGFY